MSAVWHGWQAETDLDNPDDREGVHYLTIATDDGREVAIVVHRTVGGQFPLDGASARRKEHNAQVIVDALNSGPFAGSLR